MRAALYARFSTDNQSPSSIADQLRDCRRLADRMGAQVVREFSDDAISGEAMGNRPGVLDLMAFARAGGCDVVIAEHTNRLSRAGSGGWGIFEDLRALRIGYFTVEEGEVTPLHQGVSSMVSVMKKDETRHKTLRGLKGVVESGRSGGGLSFGYSKRILYDGAGERVRGHLDIDAAQAEVVRRIFRDYAAGVSPQAIAHALNLEAVAGPRGGTWNASTIGGNAKRGNGVIHNELYRGWRVWGRQTFVKDRHTGARRGREAADAPIRRESPELRIVDEGLWNAVQARYARTSTGPMGEGVRGRRRPKRFLQGLIVCAECGRAMHRAGPREALRCATRIEKGLCPNTRTPGYPGVEARVIAAIKANLLHPDVIEHTIRTIQDGLRQARRDAGRRKAKIAAELAEVKRRLERLVDQVEAGAPWSVLAERHATLEARRDALSAELAADPEEVVEMHPAAAGKYRKLVENLSAALDDPQDTEGREGREAVRALIHQVRLTPAEGHGQYELEILGDLAPILEMGQATNAKGPLAGAFDAANVMAELGAGTGFEPVTFRL